MKICMPRPYAFIEERQLCEKRTYVHSLPLWSRASLRNAHSVLKTGDTLSAQCVRVNGRVFIGRSSMASQAAMTPVPFVTPPPVKSVAHLPC